VQFHTTVTFEDLGGDRTRITLHAPLHQPNEVRRTESSAIDPAVPDGEIALFQESGEQYPDATACRGVR
jgi:hypothetical protein